MIDNIKETKENIWRWLDEVSWSSCIDNNQADLSVKSLSELRVVLFSFIHSYINWREAKHEKKNIYIHNIELGCEYICMYLCGSFTIIMHNDYSLMWLHPNGHFQFFLFSIMSPFLQFSTSIHLNILLYFPFHIYTSHNYFFNFIIFLSFTVGDTSFFYKSTYDLMDA